MQHSPALQCAAVEYGGSWLVILALIPLMNISDIPLDLFAAPVPQAGEGACGPARVPRLDWGLLAGYLLLQAIVGKAPGVGGGWREVLASLSQR